MLQPKTLRCSQCGVQIELPFVASEDAVFSMTGSVTCPRCGQKNDVERVLMSSPRYAALMRWLTDPMNSVVIIEPQEIAEPLRAFAASWHSVIMLGMFTGASVYAEKLNQFAHDLVVVKKTGTLGGEAARGEVKVTGAEMVAALEEVQAPLYGITSLVDAAEAFEAQAMSEVKIRLGLLALFSATLVGTWTAYETLAGDLWETVVNARPALAGNVSGAISTQLLQKYRPDPTRHLGTILREMEKDVFFTSLKNIRGVYSKTFREHGEEIEAAVNDRALDALSLARNLIVHKGGRCDGEYKSRAAAFPDLPQLEIGEQLTLNGQLVVDLLAPSIMAARKLTAAVGNWMRSHPAS